MITVIIFLFHYASLYLINSVTLLKKKIIKMSEKDSRKKRLQKKNAEKEN